MTRHQMREAAFLLTFERIFSPDVPADEMVQLAKECDEFELSPQAIKLFEGVDEHRDELDQVIEKYLKNWTIQRISKVSLAVLRLAVYEMKYMDTTRDIVISEAVKLAQAYTLQDDVAFVNGVLASAAKGLES